MAYVSKRDDSSFKQFRMRVPEKVKDQIRGQKVLFWFPDEPGEEPFSVTATIGSEVKFSLKTRDPVIAERRTLVARARLQRVFDAAEKGPTRLSHRNLVAITRGIYDLLVETYQDNPGPVDRWTAFKAFTRAAMEGRIREAPRVTPYGETEIDEAEQALEAFGQKLTEGINALPRSDNTEALEQRFGVMTDWLLTENTIQLDRESRKELLRFVAMAAHDAGLQLKRNAGGDYSPNPAIARFPAYTGAAQTSHSNIIDLFEGWARERRPAPKTVEEWRRHVDSFIAFAKEHDARRITRSMVVAWKDALLEAGGSPKTINASKLAALRKTFAWGLNNERITSNPVIGVAVDYATRLEDDMQGFSDEEARLILMAAANEAHRPAIHWIPLLCATSGARVGEIAQLRAEDIIPGDAMSVMRISHTAGGVKNRNSVRVIPIHPAVIDAGFLQFVGAQSGHLFFGKRRKLDAKKPPQKIVGKNIASWVGDLGIRVGREHRKDPNHAWRHRFTTLCREHRIEDSVIDLIKGNAPASVSRGYGTATLTTMADAIQRIPVPDGVVEAYRRATQ